jgi:plasmid stabilization system protein ParE
MAGRRRTPLFTQNFSENLEGIRAFLGDEGQAAYRHLLDRLLADIVPTLCRFPLSGRQLLKHPIRSLEVRALTKRLEGLLELGDDLREFILDDYIVLYLLRKTQVIFLSLKHQKQLSFDLARFWP